VNAFKQWLSIIGCEIATHLRTCRFNEIFLDAIGDGTEPCTDLHQLSLRI